MVFGPTFNSVTVDSDTSTSDTLLLFATGKAAADGQARVEAADDPRLASFRAALNDLLKDLALQVVRDGEGARKMVEVRVTGAESDAAASGSRFRSPILPWSRRLSPVKMPIGAVSYGRRQSAKLRIAIVWPSGLAMYALPSTANAMQDIPRLRPRPSCRGKILSSAPIRTGFRHGYRLDM